MLLTKGISQTTSQRDGTEGYVAWSSRPDGTLLLPGLTSQRGQVKPPLG